MRANVYKTNLVDLMAIILDIAGDAVQGTNDEYLDAQKEQMLKGLKKDGGKIGRYKNDTPKNKAYAQKKFNMNSKAGFGNVDLKLTKSFYNTTFISVKNGNILIDSSDSKTEFLTDAEFGYGDPFGLGEDARKEYIPKLQPVFMKIVRTKLKAV